MVVSRRPPNVQPPANLRTNSTQQVSKSSKGKTVNPAVDLNGHGSSTPSEDDRDQTPKSGKSKGKHKKHKKEKRHKQTFLSLLTQVFLFIVTIYTLSVCPDDAAHEKPICRGLYLYRKLVLEPYILPPLQFAYHHPVIQTNIVQPITPYIEQSKPYYVSTVRTVNPLYRRAVKGWKDHVEPQWEKRVIPLWYRHVTPLWARQVQPHLDKHVTPVWRNYVAPYISLVEEYVHVVIHNYQIHIAPYVRLVLRAIYMTYIRIKPYVALGLQKSYDGVQHAKPYATPAWEKTKAGTRVASSQLAQKRREFVDPHLERIWDKVKELSNRNSDAVSSPIATEALVPGQVEMFINDAPVVEKEAVPEHPITEQSEHVQVPELTDDEALSVASIAHDSLHPSPEITASAAGTPAPEVTASHAAVEDPQTVVSVSPNVPTKKHAQEPVASSEDGKPDPIVASLLEEVEAPTFSTPVPEIPTPSPLIVETEEHVPRSAADPAQPLNSNPEDLSDFYAALGLDDELKDAIQSQSEQVAAETTPAEESEAERQRQAELHAKQVAEKRANIEARHTRWETKLEDLIASETQRIGKLIQDARGAAVKELEESEEFKKREDKLVQEAEKFLKGIEVYFKTLSAEKKKPEEKRVMWSKVVEKVETKWQEHLNEYQKYVHEWYVDTVNKETQEVYNSMTVVKDLAESAQTDIGLDYAWLDDVTYLDWERYHALAHRSNQYQYIAQGIQNGTDPTAPQPIVVEALNDLNEELQDVVTGFETRLRRLKRSGDRAFVANGKESAATEPEVSILPVPGAGNEGEGFKDTTPANAVIGKSKEQVLQAFDNAGEEVQHVVHTEL